MGSSPATPGGISGARHFIIQCAVWATKYLAHWIHSTIKTQTMRARLARARIAHICAKSVARSLHETLPPEIWAHILRYFERVRLQCERCQVDVIVDLRFPVSIWQYQDCILCGSLECPSPSAVEYGFLSLHGFAPPAAHALDWLDANFYPTDRGFSTMRVGLIPTPLTQPSTQRAPWQLPAEYRVPNPALQRALDELKLNK